MGIILEKISDAVDDLSDQGNTGDGQEKLFEACDQFSVIVEISSALLPINFSPVLEEVKNEDSLGNMDEAVNEFYYFILFIFKPFFLKKKIFFFFRFLMSLFQLMAKIQMLE